MSLRVSVGGDTSGFELAMARVRGEAMHMASHLTGHLGNAIAQAFSVAAIERLIHRTIAFAAELTDMSDRTGVSVEQLQRLNLAAKDNSTTLDALASLWDRVARARMKALATPGGVQDRAFKQLGVTGDLLKSGSPDDIVRQISAAFQKTENVNELLAPLQKIGGLGAGQMIALLRSGYDQQYQDLKVFSGAQADQLKGLEDKWNRLSQETLPSMASALVDIIDAWTWAQDKLTSLFTGMFTQWIGENNGFSPEEARKQSREAMRQSEAENAAQRKAEQEATAKRVAERLSHGALSFDDDVELKKAKKEHFNKVTDIKLDDLSKAGLFAGGAGSGMAQLRDVQERTLDATQEVVDQLKRTNDILDEGL